MKYPIQVKCLPQDSVERKMLFNKHYGMLNLHWWISIMLNEVRRCLLLERIAMTNIDSAFKLWCWRTLEGPLDCKEIKAVSPKANQPWICTGRTDAKAETPILWPPDAKNWFIGILMLGKIEGKKRKGQQRKRWLDSITDSVDMNLGELQKMVRDREAWWAIVYRVTKSWTWLSNWTTANVESEFYVPRLVIWNPESHSTAFEVWIRHVKVQSDFSRTSDVPIN